ncbi:MAG: PaaX family transcriptional regulator C-terminal domain-containing protein [Myxococcota bacterium]
MSIDQILSTIESTPTRSLIHALMNGYGRLHDCELPGPFLVAAAEPLGHRPKTVRQTLLRMVGTGELETTQRGRSKLYRLSAFSRANAAVSTAKLFGPAAGAWDGLWTVVSYQFATEERMEREKVRITLEMLGFASRTRGLYLHPRDHRNALAEAIGSAGLSERVMVFRAERSAGPSDTAMIRELWDIASLARGYRSFLRRFGSLRVRNQKPPDAFRTSLAVLIEFLDLAWTDPDLPAELLPDAWPGAEARELAIELVAGLESRAREHGDGLIEALSR